MKITNKPNPKNPPPAFPHPATNPTDSSAVLPTQVGSPPQPPAISDEQLDEINLELQCLAAATQSYP